MTLEQDVLRPLTLCEQWQRLTGDIGFEVRAFLVRLQGRLITEQLVEQELRRIFLVASDEKELRSGIALRFRQEMIENASDSLGLPFLCFPLGDDEDSAIGDSFSDRLLIDGIFAHDFGSLLLGLRVRN